MKLTDYYRNTVDLNDSGKGGWSSIYYGVLEKVINDNNYKKVAEIGIGYGTHAKSILNNTNVDTLFLIDPTKEYANDDFSKDIMKQIPEIPGNNFNELYDLIKQELSPWKDRYSWFRKESLTITNDEVLDSSLDCVFIDGDHSYNSVIKDLEFWWKKVRIGGQILGDDFWMPDVSNAVNDFAISNGLSYDFLYKDGSDYKIYRFFK